MTEKPVSGENARRGDAGMPEVPPADDAGERPAPPVRIPSSIYIPPRPTAPPTSAVPLVARNDAAARPAAAGPETPPEPAAPSEARGDKAATRTSNRRTASGASQLGKLLSAQAAQLKSSDLGPRARRLGGKLGTGGRRFVRAVWATANRWGLAKVGAALAAVVVLGLVIWWVTSLGTAKQPEAGTSPAPAAEASSAAPASRGPLPLEGVNPLDFRLGDCFKDFDANAPTSTVVACDTGHSAQLVAVDRYAASDAYPGREPLKQKALDTCKAAPLTDKSRDYQFSYKLAYPSSSSWGTGDRRVDCYFVADGGNVIKESLIPRL